MANILIIDDEAGILNLMTKLCRQQGHDTTPAQTGREGIKAVGAGQQRAKLLGHVEKAGWQVGAVLNRLAERRARLLHSGRGDSQHPYRWQI